MRPTGQDIDGDSTSLPAEPIDQKQKLERLQELENKLVGGEDAHNEERKKKRKKRLNDMREKQERRKRFNNAINADDDDAMIKVFDNIQDEVKRCIFLIENFDAVFVLASFYCEKIR